MSHRCACISKGAHSVLKLQFSGNVKKITCSEIGLLSNLCGFCLFTFYLNLFAFC